jgi:hypothetical protein
LGTTTRRATGYTNASGTLAVTTPVLAAEDEAVEVDLYHHFHPDEIKRAFNRARQIVWPNIAQIREIETLVTAQRQIRYTLPSTIRVPHTFELGRRYEAVSLAENLLLNPGFEDWTSGDPDNWTISTNGAESVNQEQETTTPRNYLVLSGSSSARLSVPASTTVTLLQTFDPSSSNYATLPTEQIEVNISAWVYCTVASRVGIQITGTSSNAHGGTGWELIKFGKVTATTDTTIAVGIVATSDSAALEVYIDEIIMTIGPSEGIEAPYTPINNWDYLPPVEGASNGGQLLFPAPLPEKHRIRITGADLLSSVSADTDTVEIDGDHVQAVYAKTRQLMCEAAAGGDRTSDFWLWSREWLAEYERMINDGVGVQVPRHRFKVPDAGGDTRRRRISRQNRRPIAS